MATQAEVEALYGPHVATLTIPGAQLPLTATDFPVYLDLSLMPASFWTAMRAGDGTANSLRVFVNNGGNYVEKPREIVSADSTIGSESGEVHFLTDTVAGQAAEVILYADGTSADYAVTATFGRNAVWSDYALVAHLQSGGDDSTGNATASLTGSMPDITGQIEGGAGPGSLSNYYTYPSSGFAQTATLQAWTRFSVVPTTTAIAVSLADASSVNQQVTVGAEFGNGRPSIGAWDSSGFISYTSNPSASFAPNTWEMIHGVKEAGVGSFIYLNGSLSESSTLDRSPTGVDRAAIGTSADSTPTGRDVEVDEARIRFDVLSADWIATEYANQNSPATFYSIAANDAGGTDNVTPTGITTTPTLGTPAVGQVHALSATGIETTPTLGTPAVGQIHNLTATGIQTTPTLGTPAVGQVHNLTAVGITTTPTLGTPTAGETSNTDSVTPLGLTTTPTLGTPAAGQVHNLAVVGIETRPVLGRPTAGSVAGVDSVSPLGLTVTPTLGTPQIGQVHALSAVPIDVIPELGTPAVGQVHALVAVRVQCVPVLGRPVANSLPPGFSVDIPTTRTTFVPFESRTVIVPTGIKQTAAS